ncbi:esterase-like activity of phytase family protein [Epibacterium ulvae]|uniref:esterase-like activity of phytase family protein n=1 Tax=Epibacterium ulvae TaxID=1156985 RepID=UPI00248F7300|nr:esterase-like activity of phytase family protein [Epibacterium ulvae]
MRRRPSFKLIATLLPLIGIAVAGWAAVRPAPHHEAVFLTSYRWTHSAPWFGGFSALALQGDGKTLTILGDRGTLAHAQISRDQSGDITDIAIADFTQLRRPNGRGVSGDFADSEGLAIAPDGSLYVSFELFTRVAHYERSDASATHLKRPAAFKNLPRNSGLEALAIDAEGTLYTLPEDSETPDGDIPVWSWDGTQWRDAFHIPNRGPFLPVSADFGPDGRFYVLERDFRFIGFRSRLRRWDVDADGLTQETTVFQSRLGHHQNLEGVSIWRDPAGRLRATMVSDDNFMSLLRTELVEYLLPDS